jgi:hypothetical protein
MLNKLYSSLDIDTLDLLVVIVHYNNALYCKADVQANIQSILVIRRRDSKTNDYV